MNQIKLELLRLRMRLEIVERLVMKLHIATTMASGLSLEESTQATLHSFAVDDEFVRRVFHGLDPGQVALHEMEFAEVIEQMQACVLQIAEQIRIQSSSE